jgi:hypothetical protein
VQGADGACHSWSLLHVCRPPGVVPGAVLPWGDGSERGPRLRIRSAFRNNPIISYVIARIDQLLSSVSR